MTLRALTWGKEPIYYVQKSYRKEDGKNATKNVERLGTLADLKSRFGEDDPIGGAKKYIAELTAAEKEANRKVLVEYSPTTPIAKGLMGKKVGEIAQVQVPAGLMEYEILEISL